MELIKAIFINIFIMAASTVAIAQERLLLSNKHASREAKAVYSYLQDIYGKKCWPGK